MHYLLKWLSRRQRGGRSLAPQCRGIGLTSSVRGWFHLSRMPLFNRSSHVANDGSSGSRGAAERCSRQTRCIRWENESRLDFSRRIVFGQILCATSRRCRGASLSMVSLAISRESRERRSWIEGTLSYPLINNRIDKWWCGTRMNE